MSDWQMVILILLAIACGAAMAWMITDYVAEKRIARQERELSTLRSALEINDLVVRGRAQMVDEVLRREGGAPPSGSKSGPVSGWSSGGWYPPEDPNHQLVPLCERK